MIWRLIRGVGGGAEGADLAYLFVELAAVVAVMLICLPFHEFAHAWMAKRQGDDTAFMHGRLSLDPMKHLDLFGTLMFLVVGFGYAKPVPVNPRKFYKYKKGLLLTSLAGPASNLILAFPLALLSNVAFYVNMRVESDAALMVAAFLNYVLLYNIFLMVFNMLPIPPLDGFAIVEVLLPARASMLVNRYAQYIRYAFFVLVLLGVFSGVIRFFAVPIFIGVDTIFKLLVGLLF